jgi:DNA-binding MarR family transcriptional regulator
VVVLNGIADDIEVAWARHQDQVRGALKLARVLFHASNAHDHQLTQLSGLLPSQVGMLADLACHPGSRAIDLAKNLAMHAKVVRTHLTRLEQHGLVRISVRSINPQGDRFTLTDAGRCRLEQAPSPHQGALHSALSLMDANDLTTLIGLMGKLAEALPKVDPVAAFRPMSDRSIAIPPSISDLERTNHESAN